MSVPDIRRDELHKMLPNLFKHVRVPTNAGWNTSHVNGSSSLGAFFLYVTTSATASSRALVWTYTYGLNSGTIYTYDVDWTKRLELSFILNRLNSDAEAVARIQLKEANTEGILAAKGIGLQISNLTMVGEAYGTALQTTGTLATLTDGRIIRVKIVKTDTAVEFWVDGILVESLTGTAVPTTASTVFNYMVISIVNGATGGVDARQYVSNIEVVQTW